MFDDATEMQRENANVLELRPRARTATALLGVERVAGGDARRVDRGIRHARV